MIGGRDIGKRNNALRKLKKELAPEGTPRLVAICDRFVQDRLADRGYDVELFRFGQGDFSERLDKFTCCVEIHKEMGLFYLKIASLYSSSCPATTMKELRDLIARRFKAWGNDLDGERRELDEIVDKQTTDYCDLLLMDDQRKRDMELLKENRASLGLI